MRTSLVALIAGSMIIGGAAIAVAQTDDTPTGTTIESTVGERTRGGHLEGFFSDMVAEGVISQDQADTLTAELRERFEERRAAIAERREAFQAAWEDNVLTVAELEELGAGRILAEDGPFADALEDGELTRAEFEEIRREFPRRGPGHHRFRGPGT